MTVNSLLLPGTLHPVPNELTVTQFRLWSYSHRKQEIKLLAKLGGEEVGGLDLDGKGKKVFVLVDRSLKTVDVDSGEVKPVALSADFGNLRNSIGAICFGPQTPNGSCP